MNRNGLIAFAVVAVLVLGGGAYLLTQNKSSSKTNGSNSSMDNMDTSKSDGSSDGNDENGAPVATSTVEIKNFDFTPANITVKKGTKVTWTNRDSVEHTVTETDGKTGPGSQLLAQGESYSFTYDTAGTFAYDCMPHPYMKGTVTVTE